ncbi:hypothetical protein ACOWN6_03700 [Helicobacter pylori]
MVKERLEEAHNSLKGNFISFSLLWGSFGGLWGALGGFGELWLSFIFCFLFSLVLLKFQNNV